MCCFTVGDEFFNDAEKVIFVAVSEPRLLLISNKEESQLGNLYHRAKQHEGMFHTKCSFHFMNGISLSF